MFVYLKYELKKNCKIIYE